MKSPLAVFLLFIVRLRLFFLGWRVGLCWVFSLLPLRGSVFRRPWGGRRGFFLPFFIDVWGVFLDVWGVFVDIKLGFSLHNSDFFRNFAVEL